MKWSSFRPLSVVGGVGGLNEWVNMFIARTSPATPIRYLPFWAILKPISFRLIDCVAVPSESTSVTRESAHITAYESPWMPIIVVTA